MGLKADYDLDVAQDELEEKIIREVRPCVFQILINMVSSKLLQER